MLANYHTHTVRCRHASGEDRQYVEHAIMNGLQVLGFSDHCPWVFPDHYVSGTRMLPSQVDDYVHSILDLKREYASDITIYLGFEAEYIPELMEAQNKLLADYPVDYRILGEHFTEAEPFGIYTGFQTTEESFLQRYVDLVLEAMETGSYVYVAHPDLLHFTGDAAIYDKHYRRLCEYLKAHDIPIEINILGHMQQRHYPNEAFLKIAQSVGNTAILGYDAHAPEMLSNLDSLRSARRLAQQYELPLVDFLPGLEPIR